MKNFLLLILLIIITSASFGQIRYMNQMIDNTVYSNAPEEIKNTKPFIRQWSFFEDRAYPYSEIPADAYANAIEQRNQMRADNPEDITWVSLGPTPGAYFGYGNISSRIVTGAFHPTDPNIIYIGAANGGVWKTTNGGTTWQSLTDNQPSLSMGAIAIDPVNPEIIYAGTGEATYSGASYYGRGLLKSTDGGATWTHITYGLPASTYFSRIAINPAHTSTILAAMGTGGLKRSTDAGLTWEAVTNLKCDEVRYTLSGDTAFALGSGSGLMRSIDGGMTFSNFGTGLSNAERWHMDLCLSNPAYMGAVAYGGGNVYYFRSTNYGANWALTVSGMENGGQAWYDLYIRINPWNPNNIYVGTIDVLRSTNGGTSFQNITLGYQGGSVHVDQHYLFFHPTDPNTFIVTNDGGIYKTTDNGNSFINMNAGLTLTQFYRIKASPFMASRILGGTQDNGTQQTYSTLNWAAAFGGDGGEVSFNPFNQSFILGETQNGGITRSANNGVNWTYNAVTGINTNENVAWVAPIINHPTENGVFYVARQRVYKTTNNGSGWTAVSDNVNQTNAVRELAISESNPLVMMATTGSKVFRSINGGANFTDVTSGMPTRTITSVYIHPENENIAFVTFSGFGAGKVYKTTNAGANWTDKSSNLPDSPCNDIFVYADYPGTYFVATDIGVFMTRDDGASWTELYQGLPNTVVLHLDWSPSTHTLRAGTHGRGVYEAFIDLAVPVELAAFSAQASDNKVILNWTTATELNNQGFEIQRKMKLQDWQTIGYVDGNGTSSEEHNYTFTDNFTFTEYDGRVLYRLKQIDFNGRYEYSEQVFADINLIPETATLYQNYPNPFNPVTMLRFSIPNESQVKLAIYNSLGEEIEVIESGVKNAGRHEYTWNGSAYSSGVYYYTLEVIDNNNGKASRETRKIVLMK